nr:endonuclease domain-containing 1 protein-like [Danio rerio]|eukprot:XP_005170933.2 endonuclease domain-containing 1 protein-like [Danio rerio]
MNLLLHLLMLSLLSAGSARVVQDFEKSCGQFFAKGKSPKGFTGAQYRQICQTLDNAVHFATLYDTYNKIPVYSAYVFEGLMGCTRLNSWYIEPQLDDNNGGANMAFSSTVKENYRGVHQALDKDYDKSGYDRGHLAPVYHANSQSCADATFTLTNAAPQEPNFNRGPWKALEGQIANDLFKTCTKKGCRFYVVTGVVPGNGQPVNNRVNVPSYFWTAFCCLNKNVCQFSGGAIGTNDNNGNIKLLSVAGLQNKLQQFYGKAITLFQ